MASVQAAVYGLCSRFQSIHVDRGLPGLRASPANKTGIRRWLASLGLFLLYGRGGFSKST